MLAAMTALLVAGCTQLQMEALPAEPVITASGAPFWTDISYTQSGDWFLGLLDQCFVI